LLLLLLLVRWLAVSISADSAVAFGIFFFPHRRRLFHFCFSRFPCVCFCFLFLLLFAFRLSLNYTSILLLLWLRFLCLCVCLFVCIVCIFISCLAYSIHGTNGQVQKYEAHNIFLVDVHTHPHTHTHTVILCVYLPWYFKYPVCVLWASGNDFGFLLPTFWRCAVIILCLVLFG